MSKSPKDIERYQRQVRFAPLGEEGQRKLLESRVLICGCGALGSVVADTLVRAGVGFVRIVDRDFVDLNNLHRQVLYTEQDAVDQLPKAAAAAERLYKVNSSVQVDPQVKDLNAGNISQLADDVDLIVDGTDNFETRYLINDYAVSRDMPWVFAGCVGAEGQTMAIVPGKSPCLSCIMPEPPPAAVLPTCESAGVLLPIVSLLASMQSIEAIKILSGNQQQLNPNLTVVDLWNNNIRTVGLEACRNTDCPTCGKRDFKWLAGEQGSAATSLCGRNSVQILSPIAETVDLEALASRWAEIGEVSGNRFLTRLSVDGYLLTIFADGRTIIGGTDDPSVARTVHAKYVGS